MFCQKRGFSMPGGPSATEKRGGAVSHHPLLLAIGAATGGQYGGWEGAMLGKRWCKICIWR